MGNIFCTDLAIQQRYDLKGSSKGRTAGAAAAKVGIRESSIMSHNGWRLEYACSHLELAAIIHMYVMPT